MGLTKHGTPERLSVEPDPEPVDPDAPEGDDETEDDEEVVPVSVA